MSCAFHCIAGCPHEQRAAADAAQRKAEAAAVAAKAAEASEGVPRADATWAAIQTFVATVRGTFNSDASGFKPGAAMTAARFKVISDQVPHWAEQHRNHAQTIFQFGGALRTVLQTSQQG